MEKQTEIEQMKPSPLVRSIDDCKWKNAITNIKNNNLQHQIVQIRYVWDTKKPILQQTIIGTWLHCVIPIENIFNKVTAYIPSAQSTELYYFGTINGLSPDVYLTSNDEHWKRTEPYDLHLCVSSL